MANPKCFNPEIESVDEFLQRFLLQNAKEIKAVKDDSNEKAILLANALPVQVITDLQRRLKPVLLTQATYEQLETHLTSSYGVKKSLIGASVAFLTRKQKQHESIETYSKILNELASHCGYADASRDRLLRDAFVCGLKNHRLIRSLIAECEDKSFSESVNRAKVLEQFSQDADDINPSRPEHQFQLRKAPKYDKSSSKVSDSYVCIRCGSKGKHLANKCFALEKTCNKCGKKGHLARACKGKPQKSYSSHTRTASNYIHPEEEDPAQFITIKTLSETSPVKSPQRPTPLPRKNIPTHVLPLRNKFTPLEIGESNQDDSNDEFDVIGASGRGSCDYKQSQQGVGSTAKGRDYEPASTNEFIGNINTPSVSAVSDSNNYFLDQIQN